MINHIVLVKLSQLEKRDYCIEQLRSLASLDTVRSIVVEPELGQAPNRWDLAILSQHDDAEQLEAFRVDETHRAVGGNLAPFVEAMSSVDFPSTAITVSR